MQDTNITGKKLNGYKTFQGKDSVQVYLDRLGK
jgi:hypothetical protein